MEETGRKKTKDIKWEGELTRDKIIYDLREIFEKIGKKIGVHYVVVFGSYARNTSGPLSDIDIAVKIDDDRYLPLLIYEIEGILNIDFDVVNIKKLDPIMLFEVFSTGIPIYCRDIKEYYDDYVWAIRKYLDFRHILNLHEKEILYGIPRSH